MHDGRISADPIYGNSFYTPAEEWLPGGLQSLLAAQALFPMTSSVEMAGNVGENEVTAGELKTRGYYQGSNVSYNLKKLVETGYMHHQRCEIDRRSVRVRLTPKGRELRENVEALFERHAKGMDARGVISFEAMEEMNHTLRRMERYWSDQIRYIY